MLGAVLYLFLLLLELFLAFSVFVYILSLLYSSFMGAPYVPTRQKSVNEVLKVAHLKQGVKFLELGCGDGRIVRTAVESYNVDGVGIDINPLLILIARFKAYPITKNLLFKAQNIYNTNLKPFDVIYVFLMPEMLAKLRDKFQRECRKGTVIISHGFKIAYWDNKIKYTLQKKPFPTYYYHI